MHFITSGLIALAMSTAVSAECFKTGTESSAKDRAQLTANNNSGIQFLCTLITSGRFRKDQRSSQCLMAADYGKKWDFYVQRIGGNDYSLPLSVDECTKNIRMEIVGCWRGGVRDHGNFRYS